MRSLTRLLVALAGLAIAVLGISSAAVAAPYANTLSVATNAQSYPAGSPVTITGAGATAGGTVQFSILGESVVLGTATADPGGNYSGSIKLPAGVCGTQTIQARDVALGRTATTVITVNCTSAQGGGLSSTGVAIASTGGVALALLLGGGILLLLGRRRRKADA